MGFFDLFKYKTPEPKTKTIEEFKQQIKEETDEYLRVKALGLPIYDTGHLPGVGYCDFASSCPVCDSNLQLTYRKAHRHVLITCEKKCGYEYVKGYEEVRD